MIPTASPGLLKFLIDECLSPRLVWVAQRHGIFSSAFAPRIGLRSAGDAAVVRRAIRNNYVLVTNNKKDFVSIFSRELIHPGLVCLEAEFPLMNLDVQVRLFEAALRVLGGEEPVNEVVEASMVSGGKIETIRYPLAKGFPIPPL